MSFAILRNVTGRIIALFLTSETRAAHDEKKASSDVA